MPESVKMGGKSKEHHYPTLALRSPNGMIIYVVIGCLSRMPEKKIKTVIVIGAGSIGERHIRCFLATNRAAVRFVEPREQVRIAIQERYLAATGYSSLKDAIEQPSDLAVIATPAPCHVEQAMQLAQRATHLLIEKPLSVDTRGIADLQNEITRRKLVAAVAYVYRAHPVLAEMRAAIVDGRFGLPLQLVAVSGQNFPFYRPAYRETYYARRETGGGAVQDALTHVLNTGQWLVGSIDRVVCDIEHKALAGVDVEDTAHILARHGSVMGSYSLNQYQAPNEMTITVVCERGTVRFEHHHIRWRSMEKPGDEWTDHPGQPIERDTMFIRQANAILDAVEGYVAPLCSLEEGLATLRANLAILKSADRHGWICVEDI
jgi:predicted dehydrogenase